MDSLINAAARALAAGDPLTALNRVALRDDAAALALRGIALAQLGDLRRAAELLRAARRAFPPGEALARARCRVAEAEIAFAARDLTWPAPRLEAARATLHAHGDWLNAAHAGLLAARRLALLGRLGEAEAALADLDAAPLPPPLLAIQLLTRAGIALRQLRATAADAALLGAEAAARRAGIAALQAEVANARARLQAPAARALCQGEERLLDLAQVEALLGAGGLVVDACRRTLSHTGRHVDLASRPVLFQLACGLAAAWPAEAPRQALIARAFRQREADESLRARLRVEIGRLRAALRPLAGIEAGRLGFALRPTQGPVTLLTHPADDGHGALLALLSDGQAWSSSALALALGSSQRQVQRELQALAADGRAQALGRGRARRWLTPPLPGFATTLLLPVPPAA
ncbi:helix-turn-helix domain-containing protein [Pseudomonas citronellolis]|uniref:helix-turn-helix domain-containing protein n=1 Tax=Pseudomonas citronellolis TaxID=53408 RepID=UPI0023E37F8D|nr:helix-turn-helix domain-containing protein [Pseudomonas citronellolis]MDF3932536.1 helix-turn-helix domain-containing protein [Pseudomonas citronellolis]